MSTTIKKLTYQEAYNKIIDAYFKDEILPWDASFCFCGTLNDGDVNWGHYGADMRSSLYTNAEFLSMEDALLDRVSISPKPNRVGVPKNDPRYEDLLFEGMCAALEVLKQIHLERGEKIDESTTPSFVKRELVK